MKNKKFVIAVSALVGVMIIVMIWVTPQQQEQKPLVTKEATVASETTAAPAVPAETKHKATQAETGMTDSSSSPDATENQEAAEDSTYQPLKALEPVEFEVNWDEASNYPQLDDSLLSGEQKESIQQSPIPVLLPEGQKLLQAALISTGSSWYAAAMKEDDLNVTVSGNAKVALVPDTPAAEPPELGEHETSITRVEGIVEISFKAFGIYYDVTVECYDHQNDPRCVEDNYVLGLVDALRLAQ